MERGYECQVNPAGSRTQLATVDHFAHCHIFDINIYTSILRHNHVSSGIYYLVTI